MAQAVTEFTAAMFFGYFSKLLPTLVGLLKVYAVVPETCVVIMTLYIDLASDVAPRLPQGSAVVCSLGLVSGVLRVVCLSCMQQKF